VTDAITDTRHEQSPSSFRLSKRPALDGVRGVAMLLVLSFHTLTFLVPGQSGERFVPGAFIAVNIFFVLSGFLITSLLLEENSKRGRISLRDFYTRRGRRLFPALIPVLVAYVVWSAAYGDALRPELPALGAVSFFGGNLAPALGIHLPWQFVQTWSLGIEEQFYLLWPLSLVLLLRRCRPRTMVTVLTAVTAAMAVTSIVAYQLHHSPLGFFERFCQGNGLLIGCGLALALHWGWNPPQWLRFFRLPALVLIVVTVFTTWLSNPWMPDGGFTLMGLAIAIVILGLLDNTTPLGRTLSWSPLCYLGKISYAWYLWHLFVFLALVRAVPSLNTPERVALCVPASLGIAIASRYLVELPSMRRGPARVAVVGAVASAPATASASATQ
jgi:peptidoglycan/LPS O-acetylase OafA/YrhL